MRVNVATALELRQGSSPSGRVGVLALNVAGDLASREEINADGGRVPQCGVNTTTVGIEAAAVGVGVTGQDLTAGVVILTGRVDVAVRGGHGSGEGAVVADGAPCIGVQGHIIRALVINTLNDIDLPTDGPVGSDHPADTIVSLRRNIPKHRKSIQCRPRAANPSRHMLNVGYNKTMVVGLFAGQANTGSAAARSYIGVVHTDVRGVVVGVDQARILGGPLICICNVTVGRVVTLLAMRIALWEGLHEQLTVKKSNWLKKLEGS